jgi:UDP:flavonoid glycosyltransferase YjiC (YdhE family)
VVHQRWGVDPLSEPTLHILRESFLAGLARRMGLDTIPAPARVVDPCPPSRQEPGSGAGLGIRHVFQQDDATVPPGLLRELDSGDGTKWVVVSMGLSTLGLNGASFVRNVIAAFDGLDGVCAVAPAGAAYRDQLGAAPANVRLIDPLPLAYSALHPLLARASAIVHHGGAGSTMQASAYGVPQLVLPQLGDQFAAGDALARTGAGITITDPAEQENPDRLREALTGLVFSPSYADSAAKLREENAQLPTPAQVVSELEQLT